MKKYICIAVIMIFVLAVNGKVDADHNITRGEFAQLVFPLLCDHEYEVQSIYRDVTAADSFFAAVALVHDFGLMQGENGLFNPNDFITREEAAVILVKCFEIRCGQQISLGRDTFITDWFEISKENREYIAKAATIGALQYDENLRFLPKEKLNFDLAQEFVGNVSKVIQNLVEKTNLNVNMNMFADFHPVDLIGDHKRIDLFLTYNRVSEFKSDEICLIFALKEYGQLKSVSMRTQKNNRESQFFVFHNSVEITHAVENSELQVFVWEGSGLTPLTGKILLKY